MQKTRIKQILNLTESEGEYKVCGWVRTIRHSKGGFSFVELNDGSDLNNLQIIIDEGTPSVDRETITTGCSLCVIGKLKESPGKGQKWEMQAREVILYGESDPEAYPIQKKRASFEFLRTIAHLRTRTNTFGAVFRVRNALSYAIHQFFQERGFMYVQTPIITANDAEGAGELFQITGLNINELIKQGKPIDFTHDFFNRPAYLTVSGQLEAEIFACTFTDVYTFGPTFRAENSNTARHLAEFWMIEPEMAFATLEDAIEIGEEFLKYLITYVMDRCSTDLDFFNKWIDKELYNNLENVLKNEFTELGYKEAIEVLRKSGEDFEFPAEYGSHLQSEHEKYLAAYCKTPVVVRDFPTSIKAFYMKVNEDQKTVKAMDVLFPRIGEIIGGSERENNIEMLKQRMHAMGLNPENYWWYMDLRRFGSVPHAGFGLGFERMMMFLTGMTNIRDVIPFPRTPGHADF